MLYPKIYNLFEIKNNPANKKIKRELDEDKFNFPEFSNVIYFDVDEKIDGTNIRIEYIDGEVFIGGRTENSNIPSGLANYLYATFTKELFRKFDDPLKPYSRVVLYGEGVGPKIQGGLYDCDFSFFLFDVNINGYWLDKEDVRDVGRKMCLQLAPSFGIYTIRELVLLVKSQPTSYINPQIAMEGVVARSDPQLYTKNGSRVMFKLRCKDFD